MERRDGSISLKDKRMINCYCTRRIKSPLFEQVRTRMLDFPSRYCARRIRAETHISLWRHRHTVASAASNAIASRNVVGWIKSERRNDKSSSPPRVEWIRCFSCARASAFPTAIFKMSDANKISTSMSERSRISAPPDASCTKIMENCLSRAVC